ncbi:MAG: type II toxin-antitoxin system HicB family antitoxin [Hyphomicrobiaceae bacterium]
MTMKPEYPVVLRPLSADDGGGWIAIVPDLPGCIADGDNAYEALQRAENAIEEWKDAARAMGRPIPHPDDSLQKSFEQMIPDHIRRQAEAMARQMGGAGQMDHGMVHAIIAEWAKSAASSVRL